MIQVCDPPRQRQVRRLSAEEFFTLVRCGGAGFYRPCSEVLRMLTVGEAWGTAGAALLVLPLTADTAAAAALRSWRGRRQREGGSLLTPPVGTGTELPARLVEVAAARADRLRRKGTEWAVVECTETAAVSAVRGSTSSAAPAVPHASPTVSIRSTSEPGRENPAPPQRTNVKNSSAESRRTCR